MKAYIWGIVGIIVVGGIIYWVVNKTPSSTTYNNPTPEASDTNSSSGTSKNPSSPSASTKDVTYVSQSTAVLNGDVSPNGVQTSYWYEYGLTNSLGSSSSVQLIGGGYDTYSAPLAIYSLSANNTYYYRIGAQNQYGKVYGSIESFKTTNVAPVTYVAPTAETRSASEVTKNSAVLNGATNPKGATTYYWFEYGTSPSLGNTTSVSNAGLGNSNTSVSKDISGLQENTRYYYRINAQNGYGIANGNISSFTTKEATPTPPLGSSPDSTTKEATNITKAGATLHGTVNPNGSDTTYYFEYGRSALLGLFTFEEKTPVKSAGKGTASISVSAQIASLDSDSRYYYRLVAENKYGKTEGEIFNLNTKK